MECKNKKQIWKLWVAGILLFAANAFFWFTVWLQSSYADLQVDQFLFQAKATTAGTDFAIVWDGIWRISLITFSLTAVFIFAYMFFSGRLTNLFKNWKWYQKFANGKKAKFFHKQALSLSLMLFLLFGIGTVENLGIFSYIHYRMMPSTFIEENYVDPKTVQMQFPEKKRNLIFIYLESMENTYAEPEAGKPITENYMPELSELAKNNVNFSNTENLGGALRYDGTTWTASSMVAQTSGVPLKVPFTFPHYGGKNSFLPGICTLGEILETQGYHQTLLLGSDASFANRDTYFTDHGQYEIIDTVSLKKEGRLPKAYQQGWGYEDAKLFEYAKEELTKLAATGEPFNFTTLTADTHGPNGHVCPLCDDKYEEQYANVIACSSRQVADFINWITEQPFYENTTIIMVGDHLTMAPDFLKDADPDYVRTTYSCIINPAKEPIKEKGRLYGSFDMFPTTLSALGVEIPGDRLGLGTDLFSETETLTEEYGHEELNEELKKHSSYYYHEFYKR